jgi:hypothetical protein
MKTQKIVHYKIMVSTVFPAGHPRKGQRTYFKDKIELALGKFVACDIIEHDKPGIIHLEPKLHTIRNNYPLWVERIKKVHAGKAVIDLCYWKLPGGRFTPGNEAIPFATLDKDSGFGVQELRWLTTCTAQIRDNAQLINDIQLAKNDGLSIDDFKAWFKGYDLSKSMAIIQFTTFRY